MDSLHDGERYLVEKYQFVVCPSGTLFLRLRSADRRNIASALVVGDPGGDLSLWVPCLKACSILPSREAPARSF
jgi:hypothetical protein